MPRIASTLPEVGLVDGALAGNTRALARLATHIENDDRLAAEALELLYPLTGRARTIGVTGPPGSGKSTFVNALVRTLRAKNHTCAVIAVDPSSPLTGGATLGDRIRMLEHHNDPGVFVRSTASRGRSGGLAPATSGLLHLFDASGFDFVIVETVGIGQEEIDIVELAETVVLLQTAGFGDAVQSLKAGILEIADLFVVNKADLPGAHVAARELNAMISLAEIDSGWKPKVLTVASATNENLDIVVQSLEEHAEWLRSSGELEKRRFSSAVRELSRLVQRRVTERLESLDAPNEVRSILQEVAERKLSPQRGANLILRYLNVET